MQAPVDLLTGAFCISGQDRRPSRGIPWGGMVVGMQYLPENLLKPLARLRTPREQ